MTANAIRSALLCVPLILSALGAAAATAEVVRLPSGELKIVNRGQSSGTPSASPRDRDLVTFSRGGVPVREFLSELSDISGMPFFVADDVRGEISATFKAMTWRQILARVAADRKLLVRMVAGTVYVAHDNGGPVPTDEEILKIIAARDAG